MIVPVPVKSVFRRKVVEPVIAQLKQGVTPDKMALSIALGGVIGIFPILGSTTFLCLIVGVIFKLNHPVMQLVNFLLYQFHIPMILFFVRIGEFIFGADPFSFSFDVLRKELRADPLGFVDQFGMAGVHAIVGWMVIAPWIAFAIYYSVRPILQKMSTNLPDPTRP